MELSSLVKSGTNDRPTILIDVAEFLVLLN
jgi:hypothetical protein